MNWYIQNGKESDVVLSTRVRLSRNLKGIPFKTRCTKEELKKVFDTLKEVTPLLGYNLKFIAMEDIDNLTKQTLVENRAFVPVRKGL